MKQGFLLTTLIIGGLAIGFTLNPTAVAEKPPNLVIIFADDLGYGDLSCYGHPTIHTPQLDRMATEGMRFTQFYSAANCCTPSRAALLTGRYPIRSGMCGEKTRVLFPQSTGGLPAGEITLAEVLKSKGYATACVGKWHLGHHPQYLPTNHGFDSYFGIPYSNDMRPTVLMRNQEVIENPADQKSLTARYTKQAIQFIKNNWEKSFFLYLPHTFPHTPLYASQRFKNKSLRGLYGDVVAELDWSTGEILKTLRQLGLARNTLVIFTSDNGSSLAGKSVGGSAGLLRAGKGTTWEGGHREPFIAWWPGKIKSGSVNRNLATTMDIFPTFLKLAGIELPQDRIIDGKNLASLLLNNATGTNETRVFFYYRGTTPMAARKGPWKMHLYTCTRWGGGKKSNKKHDPPLLFQLEQDPSEQYNVAQDHPEIIADLLKEVEAHKAGIKPVVSQLTGKMPEI